MSKPSRKVRGDLLSPGQAVRVYGPRHLRPITGTLRELSTKKGLVSMDGHGRPEWVPLTYIKPWKRPARQQPEETPVLEPEPVEIDWAPLPQPVRARPALGRPVGAGQPLPPLPQRPARRAPAPLLPEQERSVVAGVERLYETATPDFWRQVTDYARSQLGAGDSARIAAAADEQWRRIVGLCERAGRPAGPTPALTALAHAAVLRCLAAYRCKHALKPDRPLLAFLAPRVIACEACLPRFRKVIAASERANAAGRDMLCDFCLGESARFWPFAALFGLTQVNGDMCDACYAKSGLQELTA